MNREVDEGRDLSSAGVGRIAVLVVLKAFELDYKDVGKLVDKCYILSTNEVFAVRAIPRGECD